MGLVALVFFFRRQLHMEHPMLEVRVLKNRKFLVGTVIGMLVQAALLAAGILVPIYVQSLHGATRPPCRAWSSCRAPSSWASWGPSPAACSTATARASSASSAPACSP